MLFIIVVVLGIAAALYAARALFEATFGDNSAHRHTARDDKEMREIDEDWDTFSRVHRTDSTIVGGLDTDVMSISATSGHGKGGNSKADPALILIVIPGNPGIPDFYAEYMKTVSQASKGIVDVRCVAHLGHTSYGKNKGRVFNLEEQVAHKVGYVNQVLKDHPTSKIALAGHSVGAYICLRILEALDKKDSETRVVRTLLLFPTISDIGSTPNGKVMTPLFSLIPRYAIASVAHLLSFLPNRVREFVIHTHVGERDEAVFRGAFHMTNFLVAQNVLYMAGCEMREILSVENVADTVERHLPRITMYCGATDRWCPMSYYHMMCKRFPDCEIILDDEELRHAFVIGGSAIVGNKSWTWLKRSL